MTSTDHAMSFIATIEQKDGEIAVLRNLLEAARREVEKAEAALAAATGNAPPGNG